MPNIRKIKKTNSANAKDIFEEAETKPEKAKTKKASKEVYEEIKLSAKTVLRISSFKNDGDEYFLNYRKFYQDKSGEWKPSSQGMTIPLEKAKAIRVRTKTIAEGAEENAILISKKS
jgi:hypothetical protein